jgi:hypothetical protein
VNFLPGLASDYDPSDLCLSKQYPAIFLNTTVRTSFYSFIFLFSLYVQIQLYIYTVLRIDTLSSDLAKFTYKF